MHMEPACCEAQENKIFNHNFIFPNACGDFPAGWQKYMDSHMTTICWQKDYKRHYSVMINNRSCHHHASILQQSIHYVPVCEQQIWEAGAFLKVYRKIRATIKVHFVNDCSQVSSTSLDFHLMPGSHYYSRLVTIPDDVDYAYIEVGTKDMGPLWIENVVFTQLYPPPQCLINVNTVEAVKKIIDPVKIRRILKDIVEDVTAGPILQASDLQDVFKLRIYTFCVINQGESEARVRLQMSPDGINFVDEPVADDLLLPGQIKAMTYNYFLRYARLVYWTEDSNTTNLRIFFQGQD